MTMLSRRIASISATLFALTACVSVEDIPEAASRTQQKMNFDITVTRDGEIIAAERYGVMTKAASAEEFDQYATMNPDKSFGLIGIDAETGALLMDNQEIYNQDGRYVGWADNTNWGKAKEVTLSAYYPYQTDIVYHSNNEAYDISFSTEETQEGPLVSKTMQQAVEKINQIPIEFQHITNDIGFKICDVTPDERLQGLIHLRKMTVYNVASAGVFVNDLKNLDGKWRKVGYYRDVVVFDGDAKVGIGSENEKFVGFDTLEDRMTGSHRYYSVPDEIRLGKQYVEVFYDIDGFTLNDFYYPPLYNQVSKYALYGLLPDNVYVYGKQYTFHIGLDLSSVYHEITFAPSVGEWETKIYENNDDF